MILLEKAGRIPRARQTRGSARAKSKRRGKIPRRLQSLTDGSRN
jgi:hypothetical protein